MGEFKRMEDQILVKRFQAGDTKAFEELLQKYPKMAFIS